MVKLAESAVSERAHMKKRPHEYLVPDTSVVSLSSTPGQIVKLHGAVTNIRKMRGFAFVLLRTVDGVEQCLWDEESNFLLETYKCGLAIFHTGTAQRAHAPVF